MMLFNSHNFCSIKPPSHKSYTINTCNQQHKKSLIRSRIHYMILNNNTPKPCELNILLASSNLTHRNNKKLKVKLYFTNTKYNLQ